MRDIFYSASKSTGQKPGLRGKALAGPDRGSRAALVTLAIFMAYNVGVMRTMMCEAANSAGAASSKDGQAVSSEFTVHNAFHIAGLEGVKRNGRVDLTFRDTGIVVSRGERTEVEIRYDNIQRVQVLQSGRYYGKSAVAAEVAGQMVGVPGLGLLVMLKQDHVTSLVFNYVNQRGGQFGLVLEVPQNQWPRCLDWLTRGGVRIEEPAPAIPPRGSKESTHTGGQNK